ncbi:helix-turn-helix domain-containing protein [bacterium]|nr:helix-turn-helix domain-containing protein [bacterium]
MKLNRLMTDDAILKEIGYRLARHRIDFQLTQEVLAREAGVSKRTVERIESGATAQMSSIIRILRVLDLTEKLDDLIPEIGPRPMDLLKFQGKTRKRVSPRNSPKNSSRNSPHNSGSNKTSYNPPRETTDQWTWGDDQ